jgi:molybdopterin converting factor small subunit
MTVPVPNPEPRDRAITVSVKLFAGLREQAGWGERSVTFPAGPAAATPERLWQLLQIDQRDQPSHRPGNQPGDQQGPAAQRVVDPGAVAGCSPTETNQLKSQRPESQRPESQLPQFVRVAVNQMFADGDQVLSDGDEVAYLPAISGG